MSNSEFPFPVGEPVQRTEQLRILVEREHVCGAEPFVSMPVAAAADQFFWSGVVEAFDLRNHPFARRCYAWQIDRTRSVTVLKQHPIRTAEEAVTSWLKGENKIRNPRRSPARETLGTFRDRTATR